jgi:hypothetical protein
MIWANLLELGRNMWEDWDVPEPPHMNARQVRPYMRFDYSLWSDVTNQMATAGMNLVLIDLAEGIRYDSHPELAVEGSWTPAQLRSELARLRQMGLEPIPKLNFSTAHDVWLGEYSRMVSTALYYEVVSELIAEVSSLFDQPRFFHLGMDDENMNQQQYAEYAVVRQHDLWWHDLYFMIEQVEKQGSRAWMWSDYAWNHGDTFFRKMPRSVVQSNWYYSEQFENFRLPQQKREQKAVDTYRLLEEHGFDQIPTGSNWESPRNFGLTVEYCRQHIAPERLLGFIIAPWGATQEARRVHHESAIQLVAQTMQLVA